MNIDPLAEKRYKNNPYMYCNDNPVIFVDPNGMDFTLTGKEAQGFVRDVQNAMDASDVSGAGLEINADSGKLSMYVPDDYEFGIWLPEMEIEGHRTPWGSVGLGDLARDIEAHVYNKSDYYADMRANYYWNQAHEALDAIGFVDPTGIADGLNAALYASRGKYGMAALSMVAILPFGDFVKGAKMIGAGAKYSVAFEMKLASSSFPGVYRGAHFLEANKALSATMAADARFASSISELGITIPKSSTGSILGKSPTDWVWHHDLNEGVMQLVPKSQHTIGSSFWNALHPNGKGGFSIWGK